VEDGGPRDVRTQAEQEFLTLLLDGRPWLDVWLHQDVRGEWACVSYDFSRDGVVVDTLRLDFDGSTVRGGWSPANLNWDDGVRAAEAGIDFDGSDGLNATGSAPDLAAAAGVWFDGHRQAWQKR